MEKKDNHSKHVNKTRGTDKFIQKTRAVSLVFLCLPQVPFWSRQKTCFVAKQVCLSRQNVCCDKYNFVAIKYFCRNILFNVCRDKTTCFVATNTYCVCRDKKKLLMAAPANDRAVLTRRKVKPTKRRTNQNVALRVSSTASSSDFLVSALVADSASFFNPATSVGLPTSLQNLTSKQPLVHPSS